jgi:hypothetical protein
LHGVVDVLRLLVKYLWVVELKEVHIKHVRMIGYEIERE